jgi:predicted ferric reductase
MKPLLASLLALVAAVWGWDVLNTSYPASAHPLWISRQEALYLSGYAVDRPDVAGMLLATRPTWLEAPLGGMDRVYRTHKWAGILAISLAALHWLIEMSDDILKSTIGREGRIPKEKFAGLLKVLRDLAEDIGEWAIYARADHAGHHPVEEISVQGVALPAPCHARALSDARLPRRALLAPTDYWAQPAGVLLAALLAVGVYGAFRSLQGGIGRTRQAAGEILAVEQPSPDITTVRCRLDRGWRGHRPGQFAFVTFDDKEGAHPFTIASADQGDRVIRFQIKALGDYTRSLAARLQARDRRCVSKAPTAASILPAAIRMPVRSGSRAASASRPSLPGWSRCRAGPARPPADLHYCTRDQAS